MNRRRITIKRILLLALLLVFVVSTALADGFTASPDRINEAAKSVMLLEIYDDSGELIKTGSGFVAFDNKHLITNFHVANHADIIYAYSDVGDPYIIMDVCVADSKKDIAILQFFSPTDLQPLDLNESGEVLRASPVVAIGSPKGFSNSVSAGIVSSVFDEDGISYIQFTAPISSGSSGGALFDDDGKVIGITSASYDDGYGISQNLNFAVNIKEAIYLYESWDGKKIALSDLDIIDATSPESALTPGPALIPTPKPEAVQPTDIPDDMLSLTISASYLEKHLHQYNNKDIKLITSMSVSRKFVDGDNYIIVGYGNGAFVSFIFRDYQKVSYTTGGRIDRIVDRISSFNVSGKIVDSISIMGGIGLTPTIEVESFDYTLKK